MKCIIILICILLIVLASVIVFRYLKNSLKGNCSESCKSCKIGGCPNRKNDQKFFEDY